jgi:hypothetical protein
LSKNLAISENLDLNRQLRGKALWSALATLIDGEGCICLLKNKKESGIHQYYPVISVVNTNIAWLTAWCTRIQKGAIRGFVPQSHNWKARATWQINKKADVVFILKRILPFLFCKREQALTILEHIEKKVCLPYGERNHQRPSEEELLRREVTYLKMRTLNAKGIRRDYTPDTPIRGSDIVRTIEPSMELDDNALVQ